MQVYWEVARRGFRRYATYRAATVAGVFANTVFGFLQACVLLAVYRSRTQVGALSAPATSSPTCTGRSTCRAGGWR